MTSGELAELYAAHDILLHAYEHLTDRKDVSTIDALVIILDARSVIQQKIVDFMVGENAS